MLDKIIHLSESISEITLDEAFTNAIADQLNGQADMDEDGNLYLNRKDHTPILVIAPFFTYPLSVEKVYPDGAVGIELYDSPSRFPLPGSDIYIHGKKVYQGVIGSVPPHLQKGYSATSPYELSDLKCDVCASYEELQNTVFPGTRITYYSKPFRLLEGKIAGRNLDLIAPAAALLECADGLDKDLFTVCFCSNWCSALEKTNPQIVIVLDVMDIEQHNMDYRHGEGLGKLYVETGTTVNDGVRNLLKASADAAGIANEWLARCDKSEGPHTITWDIQTAKGGTPVGTIYLPYEGGSSGVQVMAESTAESLAKLLQQIKAVPGRDELCWSI